MQLKHIIQFIQKHGERLRCLIQKEGLYDHTGLSGPASDLWAGDFPVPGADADGGAGERQPAAIGAEPGHVIVHQPEYDPARLCGTGAAGVYLHSEGEGKFCGR